MKPSPAVLLLLVLHLLAACNTESTSTPATPTPTLPQVQGSRTFQMGISSLPPELTQESYDATFELAARIGDVVLIQRRPPWEELIDGEISEDTVNTTRHEKELADEHGLDLFVAIDPTDSAEGRREIAGLPQELAGAGFANEEVRQAFVAYAEFVAQNYQPRYLALGVEINGYQHEHPQDFEQFVVLYHEAYQAVKRLSPETLVFTTFQLEEMEGLLPVDRPYPPQWYLVRRFGSELDLLAMSSYPDLAFKSLDDMPPSYYSQIQAYTSQPIALTALGYSSAPEDGSADEDTQAVFLQRALTSAEQLGMPLVIWFLGQDLTFTSDAPFERLGSTGLKRQGGTEKPSFLVWLSTRLKSHMPQPTSTPEDQG